MRTISIAAAVVIGDDDRLLLVRKRGTSAFMQPGGKIEPGETALDAVHREVAEELGVAAITAATRPLGRFRAPAANEPDHAVDAELFLVQLDFHREKAPRPGAEIEEIIWIDARAPGDLELAPLTRDIVLRLTGGDGAGQLR